MRRFDKIKNIKKANILAEQRHRNMLNESTPNDFISIVNQKFGAFKLEDKNFGDGNFDIIYISPKFEGIMYEDEMITGLYLEFYGTYEMTSRGYYRPGKCYGPPEDCYPDESENPEFDIIVNKCIIAMVNEKDEVIDDIIITGEQLKAISSSIIGNVQHAVEEMLLDSGEFDDDGDYGYDGPDDDYDPSDSDAMEWGGMDI